MSAASKACQHPPSFVFKVLLIYPFIYLIYHLKNGSLESYSIIQEEWSVCLYVSVHTQWLEEAPAGNLQQVSPLALFANGPEV